MSRMRYIIEKKDIYKNYDYFIKFFEDGHYCGYVKVPSDKIFDKIKNEKISIECHGGITFSEYCTNENGFTEGFWIGFDCAHWNDAHDMEKALKIWNDNKFVNLIHNLPDEKIRDLNYVENECINIIEQLIKLKGK